MSGGVVDYANAGYLEQAEADGMVRVDRLTAARFEYANDRRDLRRWLYAPWIQSKTIKRDCRPFRVIVFRMQKGDHELWLEIFEKELQIAKNWRRHLAHELRLLRRVFREKWP